jgi:hypothetical protein
MVDFRVRKVRPSRCPSCRPSRRRAAVEPPPSRRRAVAEPPPSRRAEPPPSRRAAAEPPPTCRRVPPPSRRPSRCPSRRRAAVEPPPSRRRAAAEPPPSRHRAAAEHPPSRRRDAAEPPPEARAGCRYRARWVEFVGIFFKYYTRAHVYTRSVRVVLIRCRVRLSRPSLCRSRPRGRPDRQRPWGDVLRGV